MVSPTTTKQKKRPPRSLIPRGLARIAADARAITERFAKDYFPEIGNTETLECYCAIGAKILYMLAKKRGYNMSFIEGRYGYDDGDFHWADTNHCWTVYDHLVVVDVTATQFWVKDKVHTVLVRKSEKYVPVRKNRTALNKVNCGWGNQSPARYMGTIKDLIREYEHEITHSGK